MQAFSDKANYTVVICKFFSLKRLSFTLLRILSGHITLSHWYALLEQSDAIKSVISLTDWLILHFKNM